jgi:hypothetical protein
VAEVGRERGQALELRQGLAAALGVLRAQPGRQHLLQQAGLALGGHAEQAQVARLHAVGRQLHRRLHHFAVDLLVAGCGVAGEEPVLLQRAQELARGAGRLDELLQRVAA